MSNFRVAHTMPVLALGAVLGTGLWAAQHAPQAGHIPILPGDLNWQPAPAVGPGAQMAVIEGDLKTGPFAFRLKIPANLRIGVHTHPTTEHVTVLSGTFHLGIGDKFDASGAKAYPAGGWAVMPPGMAMFAFTKEETLLQVHGTGPWGVTYLDPADDPRKK
jgi:hypothetical protein